jgi:Phage terminase large subunit gpA, ATPase domain
MTVISKEKLAEYDIHCFLEAYGIKGEQGIVLDFKDHMFLWDIYSDMSPYQAIIKPPQIGATVMMIIKSLWVSKNKHKDIIYTLPTQSDVYDMGGGKVNRLVAQNPIFQQWVKDHNSVEQKAVGDNIIYYRGTFTSKQAMMVSSQLNIHDEVDASKADVIVQYETRQQAIADGWRWYFSHPSLTGHGVHKYFLLSDQKHWFIKCPHCQTEQYLSWDVNDQSKMSIDMDKEIFVCKECRKELSDDDRRRGRWVKRFNDERQYSGYWINQLMCPWISASKILKDFKGKEPDYFYNYVLGMPYNGSGNQVTAEIIERNLTDRINLQDGRIIIGVDSGLPMYVVIGNEQGIFYYGSVKTWREIEAFMIRWPTSVVVGDQGGDLLGIRALQDKYPNRVYLVYYRHDRKTQEIISWGQGGEYGAVTVDRNKAIQLVIDEFTDRRLPLFGNKTDYHDYITHWLNIFRTSEEDKATQTPRYIWERNGPDHLVHATVYYRVGRDKFKSGATFFEPENKAIAVGTPGIEVGPDATTPYRIKFNYPNGSTIK